MKRNRKKEKLVIRFLNSIPINKLSKFIQRDVAKTMETIEICYNGEYRNYLRINGVKDYEFSNLFESMSEKDFIDYVRTSLGIGSEMIKYYEFDV